MFYNLLVLFVELKVIGVEVYIIERGGDIIYYGFG